MFTDDPLVGSIARQFITEREKHDQTARLWTSRYAKWIPSSLRAYIIIYFICLSQVWLFYASVCTSLVPLAWSMSTYVLCIGGFSCVCLCVRCIMYIVSSSSKIIIIAHAKLAEMTTFTQSWKWVGDGEESGSSDQKPSGSVQKAAGQTRKAPSHQQIAQFNRRKGAKEHSQRWIWRGRGVCVESWSDFTVSTDRCWSCVLCRIHGSCSAALRYRGGGQLLLARPHAAAYCWWQGDVKLPGQSTR